MMSSVAIFCVIFGWILKEKLSKSISLALASRQQGPRQGSNVMVGRLLICGEPIFGRGGVGGAGVRCGGCKYSPGILLVLLLLLLLLLLLPTFVPAFQEWQI